MTLILGIKKGCMRTSEAQMTDRVSRDHVRPSRRNVHRSQHHRAHGSAETGTQLKTNATTGVVMARKGMAHDVRRPDKVEERHISDII